MSENQQSVLRMLDAYQAAVLSKDVDALVALYDARVCIFDLWERWSYGGVAAWRAMVSDWLGSLGAERVSVSFDTPQAMVSGDLATLHAFVTYESISADGDALRSMQNRLTWVLRRHHESWKVVHEHTSAPVNPQSLKVLLKRESDTAA